jgi:ParB family chromosome partitioning protein
MNMFEEAASIAGMIKMMGLTQSEMAEKLGVSQSYVANKIRLMKHTEEHKKRIIELGLSERHARALLRLEDENTRDIALNKIGERGFNVAETEALIDLLYEKDTPKRIGKADRLSAVTSFRESIRSSLERLTSIGVDIREKSYYYADRLYITISIDEG